MKDKLKKKLKKVVPFILIAVLSCTAVLFSYDKGNEVQAAVVVDDIMVVTTILALCGVSFLGTEELWGDGNGWYPGIDAGQDIDEWIDDFNKPWSKEWDEKTREYALEHGLIDENGNYTGGGDGNGDGGDDDDHKFPSWQKIKTLVKANGGNVATALGAYLPLITGFAYSVLNDSNNNLSQNELSEFEKANNAVNDFCASNSIDISSYKYSCTFHIDQFGSDAICRWYSNNAYIYHYVSATSDMYRLISLDSGVFFTYENGSVELRKQNGINYWLSRMPEWKFYGNIPVYDSEEDYKKKKQKIISPSTIDITSNLKNKTKYVDGIPVLPELPINDFAKLPTMDDLKDFFKKIGNDKDDKDKRQKDIDDFIKKITTADTGGGETPNPNPSPDPGGGETPEPNPGGGGSGGGGGGTTTDTPDKPDKDDDNSKKDYARDLQKIFPFCIPFDIVDCFKLFKAEPETPRVEIPIHFGIVEKDYTFVIDLKDFNNLALMLRSSLLIVFVVGLGFATRNVIKW